MARITARELETYFDGFTESAGTIRERGPETVSLFYYAGHGLESDSVNYLVPVNADIKRKSDVAATSLSVAPGATVIFGTGAAAGISISSNLGGLGSKGSARILATSKKLACTAFVADRGNAPPTSAWQLTIIAKLKQKAAN